MNVWRCQWSIVMIGRELHSEAWKTSQTLMKHSLKLARGMSLDDTE